MKIYDITAPLFTGMPKYPSLRDFELNWDRRLDQNDGVNLSNMCMQMHIGTHADAPLHYKEKGKSIDKIDLSIFVGKAWVAHSPSLVIQSETVDSIPEGYKRLLFRTPFSEADKDGQRGAFFSDEAAQRLVARGAVLVGIDSFSVDKPGRAQKTVHHLLLGAGMALLEGLELNSIENGEYWLSAAPLKVRGAEGAPCRAYLFRDI
ncbi:MAG: cyclase family protein [Caldicoprobacterales bacterium]|nr:cyclase family protein [Clostridiales bacterium]